MQIQFSEWAKKVRQDKKLSLHDVKAMGGPDPGTISRIESGSATGLDTAEQLANALGYKLSAALKKCGK